MQEKKLNYLESHFYAFFLFMHWSALRIIIIIRKGINWAVFFNRWKTNYFWILHAVIQGGITICIKIFFNGVNCWIHYHIECFSRYLILINLKITKYLTNDSKNILFYYYRLYQYKRLAPEVIWALKFCYKNLLTWHYLIILLLNGI